VGRTSYFIALHVLYASVNISKTVKLLLKTNRKLHMSFRLAPRSMTLDDLELDGGRPPLFSNTTEMGG